MADAVSTVVTTLARPRVEAAAAGVHGLEIAIGFANVPALRRVPIHSGARGGSAHKGATSKRRRSSSSATANLPGGHARAFRGSGGVAWRIEPTPGLMLPRLAAIHEFGAPRASIPERSYMRRALQENRTRIRTLARRVLSDVAAGRRATKSIDAMAAAVKAMVQQAIRTTTTPPMSEAHRLRRQAMGDPNPQLLYDTHQLHDGVEVRVQKGGRL